MTHVIIFNPAAGSGRAAAQEGALRQELRARHIEADVWRTQHSGHAVELAERAATEARVVVAAGGDGTVQAVARGLLNTEAKAALGILPMGTGNDFAKAVGVPRRWQEAAGALATSETVALDVGRVRWHGPATNGERCFVNAVGVGFDARVAQAVQTNTRLRGTSAYLAGVVRALRHWAGPPVVVRDARDKVLYDGPLFLVTLGNGICSGGGFYLTPSASPSDGALDLCLVEDLGLARVCHVLMLVLRGHHTTQPEVKMHRVRHIFIELKAHTPLLGLPVHADGELLAERAQRIEVDVLPARLLVCQPIPT